MSKFPSWKGYQKSVKTSKWLKRVWIALAILILILCISGFGYFWRKINRPFGLPKEEVRKFFWQNEGRINLLLVSPGEGDMGVLSLSLDEQEAEYLELPKDRQILTREGQYRLAEIYRLGTTLNPPAPLSFTLKAVENFLVVPLQGVMVFPPRSYPLLPSGLSVEAVKSWHENLRGFSFYPRLASFLFKALPEISSNLSYQDFTHLLFFLHRTRGDKLSLSILEKEEFQGEEEVLWDKKMQEIFREEKIVLEGQKIRILNGTEIPGLASLAARFVQNIGGEILEVGNYDGPNLARTKILNYAQETSYTLNRLEQIFGVKSEKVSPDASQRADYGVILGRDWVR